MKRLPPTHVRSIEHDVLSWNGDVLTIIIVVHSTMMYSIVITFSIYNMYDANACTATIIGSRWHWRWWDEQNTYMCIMNSNSWEEREREREEKKIEEKKVKHWILLFKLNRTKTIVYLPSNVQESRPQPLSLIDNTSHLEAKRSMRLMVCIPGQEKKQREKTKERERQTALGNRYDYQLYHRMIYTLVLLNWTAANVFSSRKHWSNYAEDQSSEEVVN